MIDNVENKTVSATAGVMSLRGTGKGFWGDAPSREIDVVRDEWCGESINDESNSPVQATAHSN